MTRFKVIREDGVTEITRIKSFRYHSQNANENVYRVGNAVAGFIEFEFYGTYTDAIPVGEVLTCYQVTDASVRDFSPVTERQAQIGVFNVTASTAGKTVCKVIAFDNIIKLDVDYSTRLLALKSQFPMNCRDLLDDAASYVGLTNRIGHSSAPSLIRNTSINYFYSNSITVRDIFSYAAELFGLDVGVYSGGEIGLTGGYIVGSSPNWLDSNNYVIAPTDTVQYQDPYGVILTPVLYKQDGAEISDSYVQGYDSVIIRKSDGTVLTEYKPSGTANSPYYVQGNPFVDYNTGISSAYLTSASSSILSTLKTYKPYTAHTFPFRTSFLVSGLLTYIVDRDGSVINAPIMSVDWTDSGVEIKAFEPVYGPYSGSAGDGYGYGGASTDAEINDKVSKSGDTMTGTLNLNNSNIDISTTPSGTVWGNAYYTVRDKNGNDIGRFRAAQFSDGRCGVQILGRNGSVENALRLLVKQDGTIQVLVSDSAAWRTALGLCYAANDTFTTNSVSINCAGATNRNSTTIWFTVLVDKSLEQISTITATSLNGWFQGPNGPLNNSASDFQFVGASGYSIACVKTTNNTVRVAVTKSSAFTNAVNNSVTNYFGKITLKFT